MLDRGRFLWIGDGSNRKSLLYKGDAARACMAVAERPASGVNIYNVSAPACTMREIVDGIADALGKHPYPCAGSGVAGFASKSASFQDTEPSPGGPPSNCEEMAG
jgi:nucleoside-diphosphate-sugar epimerase